MTLRLDIGLFLVSALASGAVVAANLRDIFVVANGPPDATAQSEVPRPSGSAFAFEPDALIASMPFGADPEEVTTVGQPEEQAVRIKLLGVLASGAKGQSWAFMSVDDGAPAVFRVGDFISDDTVLQTVMPAHVVVKTSAGLEEIQLIDDEVSTAILPIKSDAPEPDAVKAPSGLEALNKLAPANPSYGQPKAELDNSIEGIIARYREALRVNPTSIRMRLGVEKTQDGYLVQGVTAPIMLRAGFKPGDLITKINGEAVSDVGNEVELYDRVLSSNVAQVELVRNGKTVVKTFPIP